MYFGSAFRLSSNPFLFKQQALPKDGLPSTKLLIKMGFIQMQGAGLYTYLPFGLRVLHKICNMIRAELGKAGMQEVLISTMQPGELWAESGRLDGAYPGEKLAIQDRAKRTLVYGPTAEESMVDIFRRTVQSYKQLPAVWYNIQSKFRDEIRPRYGVMRAREFLMLDAYSFQLDRDYGLYHHVAAAYLQILRNLNFKPIEAYTSDTGDIGGSMSHELLVKSEYGESIAGIKNDGTAVVIQKGEESKYVRVVYGTEVGHNFFLGTTYSEKMRAQIQTPSGMQYVQMGCYGIGISRLLGVLAAAHHDRLVWPSGFEPYAISIALLDLDEHARSLAHDLVAQIAAETKLDAFVDDRDVDLGCKLSDAEMTGIPLRVVIGRKELEERTAMIKWGGLGKAQSTVVSMEVLSGSLFELYTDLQSSGTSHTSDL
jgi:prolyl-tRNA synthetase